jgi:hypothetical protein
MEEVTIICECTHWAVAATATTVVMMHGARDDGK